MKTDTEHYPAKGGCASLLELGLDIPQLIQREKGRPQGMLCSLDRALPVLSLSVIDLFDQANDLQYCLI